MTWKSTTGGECFYCQAAKVTHTKEIEGVEIATCSKCVNVAEDVLLAKKLYGEG